MKKKLISVGLTLVLALSLCLVTGVPVAADDIYVGTGVYASIQEAINAADPDDTILVQAGTYLEDIQIDKPLTLVGINGAEETIIDGNGFRYVVKIYSSNVTFEGFTVTNPTYEGGADATAILIGAYLGESVDNVHILNNIVTQVRSETGTPSMYGATGVNVGRGPLSNVVISGNTIENIKNPDGASVDHTCGINVWDGADGVEISNNTISDIKYHGILLQRASNVLIENNSMITECETGLRIEPFEEGAVSDVTVNLNSFTNNNIQVDTGGVLDVEQVLADNTFDRAVVVRGSPIKVPFIFSSIQDAVDAAGAGDTVSALPGTYIGDVTISVEDLVLESVSQHEAVVEGTIVIDADFVVVDGFIVVNFSQIPGPDYAGIYIQSGWAVGVYNNLIDGIANDPVANLTVGVHTLYGNVSSSATVQGNLIKNCRMGIYNQAGAMAILGNNIFDNAHCGIGVDSSAGVDILNNTIRDNGAVYFEGFYGCGIEVFGENVAAHYNTICGNTDYGIWSSGPAVDATNNYWCHPSGPSHSPGEGDPVSGGVDFTPWWLAPGGPSYDWTLSLKDGWTLFSVDKTVEGIVLALEEDILAVYKYTPSEGFESASLVEDLYPLTAIFVKTDGGGGAGFNYPEGAPAIDSKDLEAGWNLISSPDGIDASTLLAQLRYVTVGTEQIVGLTSLVAPGEYNVYGTDFNLPTLFEDDWSVLPKVLDPFDGYWASMEADEVFEVPN